MIYYMDGVDQLRESDIHELLPFLSQERRETMARYRFQKDRIQSALVYLLFRYGLRRSYGIEEIPAVLKEKHGKPHLSDYPDICFNMSHCERAVACGFSGFPIGVDVQHLVPYKQSIAEFFMTPVERNQTLAGDPDREFTRLWTMKESYGKYLGSGICYPMSESPLAEGTSPEGYIIRSHWLGDICLSVCSEEDIPVKKVFFHELKAFYLETDRGFD